MQVLNGQYFLDSPISVLKWIISKCEIQYKDFSTLYNGLCSHIKQNIYETDKWAGLVHLQGGICDEKQREINIKYPCAGTVMGLSGLILFTFR